MSHPHDQPHDQPHDHAHEHPGDHADHAAREWHEERLHHEDLVLDIGGDVGALMIVADSRWAEREVEVSPVGEDDRRTHTAIHQRVVDGETRYVGVYPALPAGQYRVWADVPGLDDHIEVRAGEVVTLDWATPATLLPDATPGSGEQS